MPEISGLSIRRIVLQQSKRARMGHIGSALCVADILAVLYGDVLRIATPGDLDRDRFVLAKGHAALALYAALHLKGWITEAELNSFCCDGSRLGVHPELGVAGVDFPTGSLGQGLPFGAGAALAARLQNSTRRVFVLLSDGECNEGSVWEAALFAGHHHLSNLTAIVDVNAQQALGLTRDVLDLEPLEAKWAAFGWDAVTIDGHDRDAIRAALSDRPSSGRPRAVLARTVFGGGISFMRGRVEWHYLPLSDDQYAHALAELEVGA